MDKKRKKLPAPQDVRNILIINLGGLGDFLLSEPALCALRAFYRNARIVLWCIPRAAQFAQDCPCIDEVVFFDFRMISTLRTLFYLRQREFELVLNMRSIHSWASAFKMAAIFHLLKAGCRIGRDTDGRGFFFDIRIPETIKGRMPEYQYDLNTVKALGIDAQYRRPQISISAGDNAYIHGLLSECGINDADILVGVNPSTPVLSRQWPAENFAAAINRLQEMIKCKIVITGFRGTEPAVMRFKEMLKAEPVNLAGKTTIKQLAVLIKRCNLYITNDTGSMHIASVLDVPQIALFGPGDLARFDPRHISDKAAVFYSYPACGPCYNSACESRSCFRDIRPDAVAEAAVTILGKKC
ncbi:MAG: glycosyltransferase family 9 protein [Candidatus Omnitrophica bacterium]|jgi:ADP-heptose:LPS heptosyltransferase|nr:glycosyltransferase family 9 protein [Candidatus Omnitrophota bacterium]